MDLTESCKYSLGIKLPIYKSFGFVCTELRNVVLGLTSS